MNKQAVLAILTAAIFTTAPAMGQSLQDLRKTGESLADVSEREQLHITGSTTMEKYTIAVGERVTKNKGRKPPVSVAKGSSVGIEEFCAGAGVEYPDIVASSRRMRKHEFEGCLDRLILDIIELKIGYNALVIVTKKGNPTFDVEAGMMYFGLAEKVPAGAGLGENTSKTWYDLDPRAPKTPIRVYGPDEASGSRGVWDDMMMQSGCRFVPLVREIYEAEDRVEVCVETREGEHYVGVPEPYYINAIKAMMEDPEPTLAIVPYDYFDANRDKLDLLPFEGVVPTTETIADEDYLLASPLYYYVKRAHMRDDDGVGVVRGLREFIGEMMREETIGPGGYLVELGLTPLPAWQRQEEREDAAYLRRFTK